MEKTYVCVDLRKLKSTKKLVPKIAISQMQKRLGPQSQIRKLTICGRSADLTNLRFAEAICGPLSFGYWAAHSSATVASANFEIREETSQLSDG
jgi:hypothetical protein